jgi:Fur family zinc uptake transcriptional regulator
MTQALQRVAVSEAAVNDYETSPAPEQHASYAQLTKNERLVYECLRQSNEPLKAYEILEQLHGTGLNAPMTVYRALNGLIDHGIAKKLTSLNAYAAISRSETDAARAFVVCRKCRGVTKLGLTKADIAYLYNVPGIKVDDIYIEAIGHCTNDDCKDHTTTCKKGRRAS